MPLVFVPLAEALGNSPFAATIQADIQGFDCGHDAWSQALNDYLRKGNARRDHLAQVATTFLIYVETGEFVGYITLAWSVIDATQDLKHASGMRRIPYATISVLLLSRLAIHLDAQSRGIGTDVVAWVRKLVGGIPVACRFIALHVSEANEGAIRFYRRHAFFAHGTPDERGLQLMLLDLKG